jgi:hypothetical protein
MDDPMTYLSAFMILVWVVGPALQAWFDYLDEVRA